MQSHTISCLFYLRSRKRESNLLPSYRSKTLSSHTMVLEKTANESLHWAANKNFFILQFLLVLLQCWPIWICRMIWPRLKQGYLIRVEQTCFCKEKSAFYHYGRTIWTLRGGTGKLGWFEKYNIYPAKRLGAKKISHISLQIGVWRSLSYYALLKLCTSTFLQQITVRVDF